MALTSPLPEVGPCPEGNVHHFLMGRAHTREWRDHQFLVDAVTGRTRTYGQFADDVRDGMTALGGKTPGGLGLSGDAGHVVGILSENSPVSVSPLPPPNNRTHACFG